MFVFHSIFLEPFFACRYECFVLEKASNVGSTHQGSKGLALPGFAIVTAMGLVPWEGSSPVKPAIQTLITQLPNQSFIAALPNFFPSDVVTKFISNDLLSPLKEGYIPRFWTSMGTNRRLTEPLSEVFLETTWYQMNR